MVIVEIFGLALDEKTKSPILVLKNVEQGRVLPIWIGALEAMAISMAINKTPFPRPMTHDLLLNVIHSLGGKVTGVEVTSIESGTFFAEIIITTENGTLRVDSRPSDAIALAVRAECPIAVEESVLEEAGTLFQEDSETVIKTEDSDKWLDELEKLSEEDIKYKM